VFYSRVGPIRAGSGPITFLVSSSSTVTTSTGV